MDYFARDEPRSAEQERCNPYFAYVLWSSKARRFYIGISEDIDHRLAQHNNGESKWTKRYAGSWRFVWQREFPTLDEARTFENLLANKNLLSRTSGQHVCWAT